LSSWHADGGLLGYAAGAHVMPYAYGTPDWHYVSQDGSLVLQRAHTAQNNWWSVYDRNARLLASGINPLRFWYDQPLSKTASYSHDWVNPWRPGSSQIAIVQDYHTLRILDARTLPPPRKGIPGPLIVRQVANLMRSDDSTEILDRAETVAALRFDGLGVTDRAIMRFQWHPSGEYVAVNTGDHDDRSMRRIHIVHVHSAAIVASVPFTSASLGWSRNGRYLLYCKWTGQSVSPGIWDGEAWECRTTEDDPLLDEPWALHALFPCLGEQRDALSCDGRRMLGSDPEPGIYAAKRSGPWVVRGEQVATLDARRIAHAAWSPVDPTCLATVGGEDAPESLRLWRLA
jgi:hypothetical protein